MILPNDLRIGNFVHTAIGFGDGVNIIIDKISQISHDSVMLSLYDGIKINYDAIQGIPITPEWMERFGFKKVVDNGWPVRYVLDDYNEYFEDKEWIINGDRITSVELEYVHQLQNLYFAIVGNEMPIEEIK